MTRTVTSRGRRLGAVTTVIMALLLAGCTGADAGAAAVVGGRRISVAEVQSAYRDVVPLVGQDAQFTQSVILNWLILGPYLVQEAAHEGKGVSTQDAKLQFAGAPGGADPSPAAVEVVRAILANGAITSNKSTPQLSTVMAALSARLKAAHVRINPRYGSGLDPVTSAIQQKQPDWLVAPTATPAPSTAP